MKLVPFIIAAFLLTSNAFCADANQVTLDQILAEIRALNEKVASLESRLANYEENSEIAAKRLQG